jgi:hypothetical protein
MSTKTATYKEPVGKLFMILISNIMYLMRSLKKHLLQRLKKQPVDRKGVFVNQR